MRDLGVLEDADHVRHGVDAADVGEEAVAEALAAAGALGEPGDVDHVDGRVDLRGVSSTSSSRSSRGSGTATTPRLDSADVNAYAVAAACA